MRFLLNIDEVVITGHKVLKCAKLPTILWILNFGVEKVKWCGTKQWLLQNGRQFSFPLARE